MAKIRLQTRYTLLCYIIQFTAARLKGHIVDAYLLGGQRRQVAFAAEKLRIAVVGRADGENHGGGVGTLGVGGFFLRPNFLGHVEGCPGLGPARIEGRMPHGSEFPRFPPW